jgi:N-acetylneuraminic acid mutarotase
MGVAAVDGRVYVVGGFDASGQPVATVEAYDPATDRWTQRASLPSPLHHVNVAAVGGKLYVVGGLTAPSFTASGMTLVYDPALDSWAQLTSMPSGTERGASGVAVLDGRIVVAGGLRGVAVTDASVFDPQANGWSPLQPLAVARDHLGAATVDGRVYAATGVTQGAEGRPRGARCGQWHLEPARTSPPPVGLRRGRARRAAGGHRRRGNHSDPAGLFHETESYDPATDAGEPTPRCGLPGTASARRWWGTGCSCRGRDQEGFGAAAANESFAY